MDVVVSGNAIWTDEPTICTPDQIKIRSRGCSVTGNTITNSANAISVNEPSINVSISGNMIVIAEDVESQGAAIAVGSAGISSYINNRAWLTSYKPMDNISITGNTVIFPEAAATVSTSTQNAIRIDTDIADANFPEKQIRNISITGNTFKNHQNGIFVVNSEYDNCVVSGNVFYAKPFTTSGFSSGTTMNTYAVLLAFQSGAGSTLTALYRITFTGNQVFGAKYLVATNTAAGSANTYFTPQGMVGNRLDYIQNIKTADVRALGSFPTCFANNTGYFFLDRNLPSKGGMNNSLRDGGSNDSDKKY
jgi:hypothetical protein